MLGSFKIWGIVAILSMLSILGWSLKASIENNAIKDMQIESLVQGAIELDKLHEDEKEKVKFDTKFHTIKTQIEKDIKRGQDEKSDSIDNDDVYYSIHRVYTESNNED